MQNCLVSVLMLMVGCLSGGVKRHTQLLQMPASWFTGSECDLTGCCLGKRLWMLMCCMLCADLRQLVPQCCWQCGQPCQLGVPAPFDLMPGVGRTCTSRLRSFGVPPQMVMLVHYLLGLRPTHRHLDIVEVFCGEAELSKAFQLEGMQVKSFDLCRSPSHNLATTVGFLLVLQSILELRVGGVLWGALPCSSWVYVSRGTSKRSKESPMGDVSQRSVREANLLTSRFVLLLLVAVARGAQWCVEQPQSSLLFLHNRFKLVFQMATDGLMPALTTSRFWMGGYGAFSAKPSVCVGDACAPLHTDSSAQLLQCWSLQPVISLLFFCSGALSSPSVTP